MKAPYLFLSAAVIAALCSARAWAGPDVIVNYGALDQLPPKSSTQKPPILLTPPGLLPPRPHIGESAGTPANPPALAASAAVPPVFRNSELIDDPADLEAALPPAFSGGTGIAGAAGPRMATTGPAQTLPPQPRPQAAVPTATAAAGGADDEDDDAIFDHAKPIGEVLFKNDGYEEPDLDQRSLRELNRVATRLIGGQRRILLRAFGGTAGDESHEAHRIALRRGLAVRRYLIEHGVSSDLIDVTAVGGATDGGPLDRVDLVLASS